MGQPVKLADGLILDARMAGEVEHRSIAGQIEFWAELGEALEPLLQGIQVMALMRSKSAQPLSASLESVDSRVGRRRVADHLKSLSFPHYEAAPGRSGFLVRTEKDGVRTVGRFINRQFTSSD
ncbi:MAG: hypothetical protein AAB320_02750 [Elusimicrobiota bacterium]